MPNARTLGILTLAWLGSACVSPLSPMGGPGAGGRIVVAFGTRPETLRLDPYRLESARIDGDSLHLRVAHGGGCRDHAYGLVAWDGWLESVPVQASLLLTHDDRDDPCDAVVNADLRFDLRPLRDAFRSAYGVGPGRVLLRLSDPESPAARPPLHLLLYEF